MTVIKGESLEQPTTMYSDNIAAGMTFTATKGVNFWITFEATQVTSGQFVFTVWFKHVAGAGQESADAAPEGTPLNREPREDDQIQSGVGEEDVDPEERDNGGVSVFGPEDFEVPDLEDIITESGEEEEISSLVITHTQISETIYAKEVQS